MSSYLLLSYHHGLLPLALRLKREGHAVEWVPWRSRYEKAWAGVIDTALRGESKRDADSLAGVIELAKQGEVRVLADHVKWLDLFADSKDLWGTRPSVGEPSALRACGWWDGEHLHAPHLLVVDLGAWPGGLGAPVEGGATLIRGWDGLVRSMWEPYLDALKASGHRGLVQAHLGQQLDKGTPLGVMWWSGGWVPLHLHAWLASLGSPLGELLEGEPPLLPNPYSVVVPVTVPPWPSPGSSASVEVGCPQPGEAVWHDIYTRDGKLVVAGLDGLVAVAKGSAGSLWLARRKALAVAGSVRVPSKQLRPDVGASVEGTLGELELRGWSA